MCCWCTALGPRTLQFRGLGVPIWGPTYVSIKGVPRSGAISILILTIGTPSTQCFLVATFSLLVFSSGKENINAYLCNCRDSARLADSQIETEITNEYGSACKRCHLQNAGSPLLFPIYLKPFIMESSPVFFLGENILLPWIISSIAIEQLYVRVHHTRTYNDDIAAACLSWKHKSYILRILLILHSHLDVGNVALHCDYFTAVFYLSMLIFFVLLLRWKKFMRWLKFWAPHVALNSLLFQILRVFLNIWAPLAPWRPLVSSPAYA